MNVWVIWMLYCAMSKQVIKGQSTEDDDEPSGMMQYIMADPDILSSVMHLLNTFEKKCEQTVEQLSAKLDQQSQLVVQFNQTLNQQRETLQQVASNILHQQRGRVCRPVLTRVLRGHTIVNALTSFNNQLFVTRYHSPIAVYDTETFEWIRNVTVTGAGRTLYGLAACPTDNCLYVSDYDNHNVHQLNLSPTQGSNTAATATSWSVGGGRPTYPAGLSVNRQHNLLVALLASKKIAEYTASGSLVRETSDSNQLWHAVDHVVNGAFVVSRQGPVHGVGLMSVDGRVIHSYGNTTRGSGPGQMNVPRSLAVDRDGYVLVADETNHRILALNPTLSEARPLPLPTDATGPTLNYLRCLWLDELRGRLYIGEAGSPYRVLVYDKVFNIASLFAP